VRTTEQYATVLATRQFPAAEVYGAIALHTNSGGSNLDFTVLSVGIRNANTVNAVHYVYTLTSDVATVTKTLDVAVQGAPYTSVVEDARPPRRPVPNTPDGWYYHKDATDTSAAKTNWYLARSGVRSLMAGVVSGRVAGAGCGVWGVGCWVWGVGYGSWVGGVTLMSREWWLTRRVP
jgi:hypothetical protein